MDSQGRSYSCLTPTVQHFAGAWDAIFQVEGGYELLTRKEQRFHVIQTIPRPFSTLCTINHHVEPNALMAMIYSVNRVTKDLVCASAGASLGRPTCYSVRIPTKLWREQLAHFQAGARVSELGNATKMWPHMHPTGPAFDKLSPLHKNTTVAAGYTE